MTAPRSPASPLATRDAAWQTALSHPLPPRCLVQPANHLLHMHARVWPAKGIMLFCACSPATHSPSKQSRGSIRRPTAASQPAQLCLSARTLPKMLGGLTASEWENSDEDTWESESFESMLSSIAAFDMEGALDRMTSADTFYTPEAVDSSCRASPAGGSSFSQECLQLSDDGGQTLERSELSLHEQQSSLANARDIRSHTSPLVSQGSGPGLPQTASQVQC